MPNLSQSICLFPGQGSQKVGMGKDLSENFKEFTQTLEEASDTLGFDMAKLCFEDPDKKLNLTEFTQPAIVTISTATLRVLKEQSDFSLFASAGHSLGEYSALVASGAMAFTDALKAVHFRGQAMQRAVPVGAGAMAAYIGTQDTDILELCETISQEGNPVQVVNFNSPSQFVLSGSAAGVAAAVKVVKDKKWGRAVNLPVSAPFHSTLMQPAAQEMETFLQGITLSPLEGKLVANVDAQLYREGEYTKEKLVSQVDSPVLWTQSLQTLQKISAGKAWIEVGPGKVLAGLLKKTFASESAASTENIDSIKNLLTS